MPDNNFLLSGTRVLEIGNEQGDYCGRRLASLGAEVVKIEPPGGSSTRNIGPFYHGERHPERSLYFWHFNAGKRGITLDLERAPDRERFSELVKQYDVLVDSMPPGQMRKLGLGFEAVQKINPRLVHAQITPFGLTGPYANYKGSDLVHLAMGGPMMNCGYYPDTFGHYDTPPMAGQMWQAYQIAGELTAISILGALIYRNNSGQGQHIDASVHQIVSCSTERDVLAWVYTKTPLFRMTGRGAGATLEPMVITPTKDGRWFMPWARGEDYYYYLTPLLEKFKYVEDLRDKRWEDPEYASSPERDQHLDGVVKRFISRVNFEGPWRDAQDAGILWAPVRKPEDNLADKHWNMRQTFAKVEHPEVGKSFVYPVGTWYSDQVAWKAGPRAPLIGEHNHEVLREIGPESAPSQTVPAVHVAPGALPKGRAKPFAINGVRILDLTQMLASAGGPRFLSALGAEVLHLDWRDRPAGLRRNWVPPAGNRDVLEKATSPVSTPYVPGKNVGGFHNDTYSGRYGFGLNLGKDKGKEIFRRLVEVSDVVTEGFRNGVMEAWGFGYENLKKINPTIIYVSQSGFGAKGLYKGYRSLGPIAGALSGNTEMIGLPEPYPPCAWGYSYLDWFGAYNFATALLAALHYRERTGKGLYIDSSQTEIGICLSATALLDFQANRNPWRRVGNRSPWKKAAPHNTYRARGEDQWVVIACFTEEEWAALCKELGKGEWLSNPCFATLEARLENQGELDALVEEETVKLERYEIMHRLQRAGVPSGVCQTAQDRVERDPQLQHLEWLVDLPQKLIGTWPVKQYPVALSATPGHVGGRLNRASPAPSEHNAHVLQDVLGLTPDAVEELAREGVI